MKWNVKKSFFACLLVCMVNGLYALDLEELRRNYLLAPTDKHRCEQMVSLLSRNPESSVHQAYLGAFKMIWARHVFNPFSKLKTFNAGKTQIEEAVRKLPQDAEIRFLRFSVQKNAPSFLGYKRDVKADREFLQASLDKIESPLLKKMITDVLRD